MIRIREEPQGQVYEALLKFAATNCATFSLTWHMCRYKSTAHQIEKELTPFRVSQKITDNWPGTIQWNVTDQQPDPIHRRYRIARPKGILLRTYRVTPRSIDVLQTAGRLYAWLRPDRPEDLAFYLPDGSNFLASVAHEELAWFMSDICSEEEIVPHVHELRLSAK
ncbi:hypothetical protein [Capsulimonas corticalis]|uniref:hypothetical protein n=1 Tax=Capsulimonas corticalis TaxID=2219043 RepID=UPI000F64EFAF|nr:hypothetical protein [Capsulimonas corticalis]